MVVGGIEYRLGQVGPCPGNQGAHEDPFGRLRGGAVTCAGTAEAARVADIFPVGGTVDGAVEIARIDEGLQQPQRVTEAFGPILRQAAFAQREDT